MCKTIPLERQIWLHFEGAPFVLFFIPPKDF